MTPLTMIGEVSNESSTSVWKIQAGCRRATFCALISAAGQKRLRP
jgi:hypothetical protein